MFEAVKNILENIAGEFVAVALTALFFYLRSNGTFKRLGQGRLTSSPDHTKVASEAGGEIYVVDKSGVKNLTNHPAMDRFAVWHPDSIKMAFVSERDGTWQVWVANTDTGRFAKLTSGEGKPRPILWDDEGNLMIRLGGSMVTVWKEEIEKKLQ